MSLLHTIKANLVKNISNIPGWSTKRKIVLFLVDDWGTIRIPSRQSRDALEREGIPCLTNRFNAYDTLASNTDLSALFEVLKSVKDRNGNAPSFTALTTVVNPSFDKIRESEFQKFVYEPFTETLERYYPSSNVFALWKQGIDDKLFVPQFHGREHFHNEFWLNELRNGNKNLKKAFEHHAIGVPVGVQTKYMSEYMAAFDFEDQAMLQRQELMIEDGIRIFKSLFGYSPILFTSTSLLHNKAIEPALKKQGIDFIDRSKISFEPLGNGNYKKEFYKLGQQNQSGQKTITRNCMFEPNANPSADCVDQTLKDMATAFRWNKPAIISSHRVNFVGGIEPENRDLGLKSLSFLLLGITRKWPDAEFMTFNDFAKLLQKN